MALLSVEDLVVRFRTREGTIHAVNGVTFELEEGERLGLVGESGCGKSVTNLAVIRLLPKPAGHIEGGRVIFDGQDLATLPESEIRGIRGRDIAMIFQDPMTSLNPVLTIREQMVETIQAHKKVSKDEAKARAVELLAMVGIPKPADRLNDFPHQFSGGMRQRVMIAMALINDPVLLIADEPTTALDVTVQAQILDLLQDLQREFNTALILITHDLGVIAEIADDVLVMYAGRAVEYGTTRELLITPAMPYTWGLIQSVPDVSAPLDRPLRPIPGNPPSLLAEPTGCPFFARCEYSRFVGGNRCATEMPQLLPVSEGHLKRCHLKGSLDVYDRQLEAVETGGH